MSVCPRCHQRVDPQAVSCPTCHATLKAFGHPGIPLHQAKQDTFLCDSCTYHADDTCTYPQRPYAKTCTLYQNQFNQVQEFTPRQSGGGTLKNWWHKHQGIVLLLILLAVGLVLAI